MTQIFYIIRHGETDWNVQRRLQGHSDIDLNKIGEEQARGLRQRFDSVKIDHVITSDLIRARRTAELAFVVGISTTKDLREVFLGEGEGQTRDQLQAQYGEDFFEKWTSHSPHTLDMRFSKGESKRELLHRVLPCLHYHLDFYSDQLTKKTLAFVSHGLAMRTLLHHLHPDLTETQFISNCGVLKMGRDQDRRIYLIERFDKGQIPI
jgi:broad specificity phosphatase PhoE